MTKMDVDPFACFHPVTAAWFRAVFDAPTAPQRMGWPVIARRENALILAPTGTGKTLTAFLWCLDRLMLQDGDIGTEGQRDKGTEGQRDKGTEGPRDKGTEGPRDRGTGSSCWGRIRP
jgi:superfamily II DNA/RNA helicase